MAAELPYATDPTRKPAAAAATTRRVSRATVAVFVFLALSLALSVRRVLQDDDADRGMVAFLVFAYLNVALFVCALRRATDAPLGSPARGRAKLAVWLLTTTLFVALAWKVGEVLPLGLAVAGWVVAAATVGGVFYVLFLRDDEKPSAESLVVRDCEREGADLSVLASYRWDGFCVGWMWIAFSNSDDLVT